MPHRPERREVWIVDDSPTDAARAAAALMPPLDVRIFTDGSAALEALDEGPSPDLLVVDWVMPGISGIELCRYVRQTTSADRLGIVIFTAYGSTEQVVEAFEAGANDYVSKPIVDAEFRARVTGQLRLRELRDRAEEAERRMREVLENAPDALIELDRAGRIRFANRETERVLGESVDELVGDSLVQRVPDLYAEETLRTSDVRIGDRVYSPSFRAVGRAAAGIVALRDVTDQRKAEERRLDFYSVIAHDLRTPLVSMQLRTSSILRGRRGILSAEVVGDLQKIMANIRSLVALINDFLDLARLEVPGYGMEIQRLDLVELIGATLEEFQPLMEASRLQLDWEPAASVEIEGDPSRLKQVVSNLVSNAIKFTPAGGRIALRLERREKRVRCLVQDTGRGIAPDLLERIFERYARGVRSRQEPGGTGLGLMIAREILNAHGGTIGVESELGRGSTFWFELPLPS